MALAGRASSRPAWSKRGGLAGRVRSTSGRRSGPARGKRRAVWCAGRRCPRPGRGRRGRERDGGPLKSNTGWSSPWLFSKRPSWSTVGVGSSPSGAKPWGWGDGWRGCGGVWWSARGGAMGRRRATRGWGGAKQATQQPTACMRMTQWAAVIVRTVEGQRHLAQPLSAVQPASRNALDVPVPSCTLPPSGCGHEGSRRPGKRSQAWARRPRPGPHSRRHGARDV